MIFRRRKTAAPGDKPAASDLQQRLDALPSGTRIYAIGDIHGQFDLLRQIHAQIDAREARDAASIVVEITLGDHIDRGPNSRGVVDLLIERRRDRRSIALLGNHEVMLLQALADPLTLHGWLRAGGLETLQSYGVRPKIPLDRTGAFETAAALQAALPPEHLAFYERLPTYTSLGDFSFIHAGMQPGLALEQQTTQDLTEIREPFLSHSEPLGTFVIHGHSPVKLVDIRSNRINVDTGAYATGRLSCLVLQRGKIDVMTADRSALPS